MAGIEQEHRKMKTQEIMETTRDLLNGTIYDAESFSVQDCEYIRARSF